MFRLHRTRPASALGPVRRLTIAVVALVACAAPAVLPSPGSTAVAQEAEAPGPVASSPPAAAEVGTADWKVVVAGEQHTCGIRTSGRLFCWGENGHDQLGIDPLGGPSSVAVPTEVFGGATSWASVSLGAAHTCALKTNGRLFCWGDTDAGQTGDALGPGGRPVPAEVFGGSRQWASVSAGGNHTCARRTSGRLYCWGADDFGQLGDGGTNDLQFVPIQVAGRTADWASVDAGGTHTCARKTTGRLYCWGDDEDGALGDGGTNTNRGAPVEVAGQRTDWASVSAGWFHTCARRTNGRLYCWGDDRAGGLGDGLPTANQTVPVQVAGGATDWASVSAGGFHTCARKTSGRLFCWGNDANGAVGDGAEAATAVAPGASPPEGGFVVVAAPAEVAGGRTSWSQVSAGRYHACARRTDRRIFCWGLGAVGQLGNGTISIVQATPVQVH